LTQNGQKIDKKWRKKEKLFVFGALVFEKGQNITQKVEVKLKGTKTSK